MNAENVHNKTIYLITGGAGFIGSHVAKHLHSLGAYVRIADIAPPPGGLEASGCPQYFRGNICDVAFCSMVMQNVHTVIHLAANMGGMGAIHEKNDYIIYRENHAMTVNVLETALKSGVHCFLYASSACVYPESLQSDAENVVRLKEDDVWNNLPPAPQGLYGFEKLQGEMLLRQFHDKIDIRIARFHNVYGVGGTWHGGREKAPAAMARKAVAIKLTPDQKPVFELWGNGTQKRSFIYIDDAVEAVVRFLEVSGVSTVNIGSEDDITIGELGRIAIVSADIDPNNVAVECDLSKPQGVKARTSNNDLVTKVLNGWKPRISLDEGMKLTTAWIEDEIRKEVSKLPETHRSKYLSGLKNSVVVDLEHEAVTFGILLPITSRGAVAD